VLAREPFDMLIATNRVSRQRVAEGTTGTAGDNQRGLGADAYPLVLSCPQCRSATVHLATIGDQFFYLRCEVCDHIWSHPERRQLDHRTSKNE